MAERRGREHRRKRGELARKWQTEGWSPRKEMAPGERQAEVGGEGQGTAGWERIGLSERQSRGRGQQPTRDSVGGSVHPQPFWNKAKGNLTSRHLF